MYVVTVLLELPPIGQNPPKPFSCSSLPVLEAIVQPHRPNGWKRGPNGADCGPNGAAKQPSASPNPCRLKSHPANELRYPLARLLPPNLFVNHRPQHCRRKLCQFRSPFIQL